MSDIIPKNAEKVFSWVRMDIYQWDQEMYDGSIARFERARFLDGAFTLAITGDQKILLTLQEQPARLQAFLSLPGWAFDTHDEHPLLCAKRELLEETGYEWGEWKEYFVAHGTNNVIAHTHFYIAQDCKKTVEIQGDPGEKIHEILFLDFDEFLLLSEDSRFIHWSLLPRLFAARLHPEKHDELKNILWL
jgi:ADP-ribose pyrophosphatase